MKRFIETTIWTQNKWFRKMECKYKLLWFYLISNCDSVGVWEEDLELVSFIVGVDYKKDDVLKIFNGQIKVINGGKKWWLVGFCGFQYGELKEENTSNRPHQSYITALKKHSLWQDYIKTIKYPSERVKEKDMDKDKDKDKDKNKKPTLEEMKSYFKENGYRESTAENAWNGYEVADWHDSNGKKIKNWKQKCIHVWFKDSNKEIIEENIFLAG